MSLNRIKDYIIDRFNQRFFTNGRNYSSKTTNSSELSLRDLMMKLEPIFVALQSLLIWEKPYISAIALIAFNCIFWLIVFLNRLHFYSILAIVLFSFNFFKLWTQYIWPEIRVPPNESTDTEGWTPVHPQVLSAPELNHYINEFCVMTKAFILWLIELRREKSLRFLILTTSVLLMTAYIGRLVPGVVIVYTIMMALALGPGLVLYVLPEGLYEFMRNYFNKNRNTDESDGNEEESTPSDDISTNQRLSESALHQYLRSTEFNDFELNPFDSSFRTNDSSLQLLSDTQLETTLDKELGIEVQLPEDDIKFDTQSTHSSRSSSSAIRFVTTYFSRNSSSENIEDEFELISDSEIQDFAKGSITQRQKNF